MSSHLLDDIVLTDLSPGMLAVSRALNPGCEHLEGDMRTLRLKRVFDAVFVHDAIDYMTTSDDLRQVMVTARTHCKEKWRCLVCARPRSGDISAID